MGSRDEGSQTLPHAFRQDQNQASGTHRNVNPKSCPWLDGTLAFLRGHRRPLTPQTALGSFFFSSFWGGIPA